MSAESELVQTWADEIGQHYGISIEVERSVFSRSYRMFGSTAKVRHVPPWRVSVYVTEKVIEDVIDAGIIRGSVNAAWGEYAARYSRYCHEYPRKQARRVRMARKRRRGYA